MKLLLSIAFIILYRMKVILLISVVYWCHQYIICTQIKLMTDDVCSIALRFHDHSVIFYDDINNSCLYMWHIINYVTELFSLFLVWFYICLRLYENCHDQLWLKNMIIKSIVHMQKKISSDGLCTWSISTTTATITLTTKEKEKRRSQIHTTKKQKKQL